MTHLILGAPTVSLERLKLELSNFVHMETISSLSLGMATTSIGRGPGHVTYFIFLGPIHISGAAKAKVVKFCTQAMSSVSLRMTNYPQIWTGSRDPFFNFGVSIMSLERVKL